MNGLEKKKRQAEWLIKINRFIYFECVKQLDKRFSLLHTLTIQTCSWLVESGVFQHLPLVCCTIPVIIMPSSHHRTSSEMAPWVVFRPLSDPITWRLQSSCPCSSVWWVLIRGWHLLTAAETNKGEWEGHFGDGAPSLRTSSHIKWGTFGFQMKYLVHKG